MTGLSELKVFYIGLMRKTLTRRLAPAAIVLWFPFGLLAQTSVVFTNIIASPDGHSLAAGSISDNGDIAFATLVGGTTTVSPYIRLSAGTVLALPLCPGGASGGLLPVLTTLEWFL
jgi:hypothetical protein